ncbi:hypothetical protein [Streptomyces sp. NPDC006132]|uniref:hypothetical protein n=1 Tax=Streptomyces sp. NPDC006132 TaxID=3156732 RepID=UPI0033F74FEE
MITTNAIGDWTWEVTSKTTALRPMDAADTAVAVWNELARHELAIPMGKVGVTVRPIGNMRDFRIDAQGLSLEKEPLAPETGLSCILRKAEALQGDFLVTVRVECPGTWWESRARRRAEKLFVIHVDLWEASLLAVTLETYSDAWLTMDTRDREQPEIFAQNAPRLTAALEGVSALLGSPPSPGDPNRFATPTQTGFEDPRVEGTAFDDSWGTFEIPARAALLHSVVPESKDDYEEVTERSVRYFTIQRDGRTLGYLWAAVGEEAAGYEPRTAAGDDAFAAGAEWLLRLRTAHSQGLNALAALEWAARQPLRPEIGLIAEATPQEAPSLDALQDMSGRY